MGKDLTSYTTYQSLQGTWMNQVKEASRLPITGKYGVEWGWMTREEVAAPHPVLTHNWTSTSHLSEAQGGTTVEVGSKDCKNQRLGSTGEKQGLLDTSGLLPSGTHGTCGHLHETSARLANILHEPMPVTDQQSTLVASRGGKDGF